MPSGIRCSLCGSEAEERGIPDPELWDDPYCPRCAKPLTPEGLCIDEHVVGDSRIVRELGKGGIVIWEYPAYATEGPPREDDAKRFLRRIQKLEAETRSVPNAAVSIVHGQTKWNRKAAARRFRRWFHSEFGNRPLEIADPALRGLALRILKGEPGYAPLRDEIENEQKYFGERLAEYRARASSEEP